jgi:hypothetical protein
MENQPAKPLSTDDKQEKPTKKPYSTPQLFKYGNISALTLGGSFSGADGLQQGSNMG